MAEIIRAIEGATPDATGSAGAEREGFDFGAVRLSDFGPADIITLPALAAMLGRCPETIQRAISRGELPEPTRLCGVKVWTAGSLTAHLETRLALAAKDRERLAVKLARLAP